MKHIYPKACQRFENRSIFLGWDPHYYAVGELAHVNPFQALLDR